jgi:hypothetical protein
MEMIYPPPFRSKVNDHATTKDFDMTSPLSADGSNFPCKGYHSDFGTPAGASTATFAPGQSYKFTISGGASHNGGSCQASLSYDKGKTWTVIHSYIGNCPLQGESDFDFAIPALRIALLSLLSLTSIACDRRLSIVAAVVFFSDFFSV